MILISTGLNSGQNTRVKGSRAVYGEIGSEFHSMSLEQGKGVILPRKGTLVFSGRSAIEAVLKHLPDVKTALLPSYCCDSIIEPFRRAEIEISFYDVNDHYGLEIQIDQTSDILLFCNYFGFKTEIPEYEGIIIEDITHSFFSDCQYHVQSDYLVASLRKWEPIYCGGYCSIHVSGCLPPEEFIEGKKKSMKMKTQYLEDYDKKKKEKFFLGFGTSNMWLGQNYSGLLMDTYSKKYLSCVDMERQKYIRRRNAHMLYEGLQGKYQFLFSEENMDCPLFVPILIEEKERDRVRRKLIDHQIYCPVHWPHPNAECESNLYDRELSLICDQRYDEGDMERIISVLCD